MRRTQHSGEIWTCSPSAALVITGFTACAEFGSYAFVHPVIHDLPPEHHVRVEKGLLRTFGRVMPVLMTLCVGVITLLCDPPFRRGWLRPSRSLGTSCVLYPRPRPNSCLQRAN